MIPSAKPQFCADRVSSLLCSPELLGVRAAAGAPPLGATSLTRRFFLAVPWMLLVAGTTAAQAVKRRRVGYISAASRSIQEPYFDVLRQGLLALGYCTQRAIDQRCTSEGPS